MSKRKLINWRERLVEVQAKKRPKFNEDDYEHASEWETCAVGEWHQKLPEVVVYMKHPDLHWEYPIDVELRRLGDTLPVAIATNNFTLVSKILDEVEDRVQELKLEKTT